MPCCMAARTLQGSKTAMCSRLSDGSSFMCRSRPVPTTAGMQPTAMQDRLDDAAMILDCGLLGAQGSAGLLGNLMLDSSGKFLQATGAGSEEHHLLLQHYRPSSSQLTRDQGSEPDTQRQTSNLSRRQRCRARGAAQPVS